MKPGKILFKILMLTGIIAVSELYAQDSRHHSVNVDSLEEVIRTGKLSDAERLKIYNDLSWHHQLAAHHEGNKYYAFKGFALAKQMNNSFMTADFCNNIAVAYYDVEKHDSAMCFFDKALIAVAQAEEDKKETTVRISTLKGMIYGSIANLHSIQGQSHKAIENYFKAMALFEQYGDKNELSNIYGNMGATYFDMENYEQAEIYFIKKMNISREQNLILHLADALNGLGVIHTYNGKYSEALACAEEADRIYADHPGRSDMRMSNFQALSDIWLNGFGNDKKAMEYAVRALEGARELDISLEICRSLQIISQIYYRRGDYAASERMALEALATDSTHPATDNLLYETIIKSNIMIGNREKSLEYFDRFKKIIIAFSNKNYQEALTEMEVKYETEKKETRIALLESERQLIIGISIASGAVLLSALAAFFFLWRWTVQKKRLAESQKELSEQEKQLIATQAVLDGETQERIRLARDLHDGLGSMLTGVKLNLESLKNGVFLKPSDMECLGNALKILDDSMRELRRVAHHLMPEALSSCGLKPAVADFCRSLSPNILFDWFGGEERLDPKLEEIIYRIVHELVNNSLKYADASQIMVQIMQEDDRIALTVQDDGCGFDPETVATGMGLSNIRIRVASFGGNIQIHSKADEGTEISIEFQLKIES